MLLRRGAPAQASEQMAFLGKQDAWTLCPFPSVFAEVFSKSRLSASFSHINRPLGEVSIQLSTGELPWTGARVSVAPVMNQKAPKRQGRSEVQRELGCSVAPPFPNSRDIF